MGSGSFRDDLLTPRGVVWQRRLEMPVLVSAVLVVPVMLTEYLARHDGWLLVAFLANWMIWAVFAVELCVLTRLARPGRRRQWLKAAWLDVVIVVVAFPVLPFLLNWGPLVRVLRLARAVRVIAAIAVLRRSFIAMGRVFAFRKVGYVVCTAALLAVVCGSLFAALETESQYNSVWWALALTTVGYGDYYPSTVGGQLLALLLIAIGIGTVTYVTASIISFFIVGARNKEGGAAESGKQEAGKQPDSTAVLERLDSIDRSLRELIAVQSHNEHQSCPHCGKQPTQSAGAEPAEGSEPAGGLASEANRPQAGAEPADRSDSRR